MTPKEKADELVSKFINKTWDQSGHLMPTIVVKECAEIAVDEMLEVLCAYTDISKDYEYWQEVKKEIEKL